MRALVHLLLGLEILNAECMRRFSHRTIRTAVGALRRGDTDAEKALYNLTRRRKVYGKPLEAWYAPPEPFRRPPPRTDTRSARAAAWAEHDELCLAALTDVVSTHEAAKGDVLAGRVDIPPLPPGPFASLLPIRRPWWTPCAVHLCSKHVQESLAELYEDTDDSIETYPLKAHDRLRDHHEEFVDGHLPIAAALTMGARLQTGRRKGVPCQMRSTRRLNRVALDEERVTNPLTPAPDPPPPLTPPDFAELLEAFVTKKKWGRRFWKALCLKIKDERTSWETVAKEAGITKAEMLERRKILKAWRREQQRE